MMIASQSGYSCEQLSVGPYVPPSVAAAGTLLSTGPVLLLDPLLITNPMLLPEPVFMPDLAFITVATSLIYSWA